MMWSRVDLPEPEGPMMDKKSPAVTVRLISFNMKGRFAAYVNPFGEML